MLFLAKTFDLFCNPSTKMECDCLNCWIKNGHICKNLTQNDEPQRYSWGMQKKKKKKKKKFAILKMSSFSFCQRSDCLDHAINPVWTYLPHITQLCGLCCVEETTARLVYCDSVLLTQLCGLCCVEETTARLVYCDSVLLTQLCGLCCVEETTARLVYCDSVLLTQLCGLCCVVQKTARLVYCDSVLLTQLCGLCCVVQTIARLVYCDSVLTHLCGLCSVEETTARLVYCHTFLPMTAAAMQFLTSVMEKDVKFNSETLMTVIDIYTKTCTKIAG